MRYRHRLTIHACDMRNILRHGVRAPKKFQLFFVRARNIIHKISFMGSRFIGEMYPGMEREAAKPLIRRRMRDFVSCPEVVTHVDYEVFLNALHKDPVHKKVRRKLETGMSWRAVGEYDRMRRLIATAGRIDGCSNEEDLDHRYRILDAIIAQCARGEPWPTQRELGERGFREAGGILASIGRSGAVHLSAGGNHRLSIAQHFDVQRLPVCLVSIHAEALSSGRRAGLLEQAAPAPD